MRQAATDQKETTMNFIVTIPHTRPARMKIVRANGTERTTTWRSPDAARTFALDALDRGDYRTAHIEVDGDWVEVRRRQHQRRARRG